MSYPSEPMDGSPDPSMSRLDRPLPAGMYRREPLSNGWPELPVPQPEDLERAFALLSTDHATPLIRSQSLSSRFDRDVYMKLEMNSPVRSFKHRGALVAIDRIAKTGRAHTVVTASTGNHGQGIAYAATRLGLKAVVYAPAGTIEEKVNAMRSLGATVKIHGANLAESQRAAFDQAGSGAAYVEDGENPELMAGAASVGREIIDDATAIDTIIVPTGGGNLIGGTLLARAHCEQGIGIIGVQSSAGSAATQSWLASEIREVNCTTFAGGLATTRPGEMALAVMVNYLNTMALVDDHDLYEAIGLILHDERIHLEGAASAPVAALKQFGDSIPGERIALVLTGSWSSDAEMAEAARVFEQSE